MKDRFDLESAIMDVWATKDHLNKVIWRMMDYPERMSEDQIWNHLEAVKNNIDLHCEVLMDTFCQVFQLNEYATQEMKDLRKEMLDKLTNKADKEDAEKFWKEKGLPEFPVKKKKQVKAK
jgi:hypothetical protein